jgi:O-antigen/teichoic acid export membrane protein
MDDSPGQQPAHTDSVPPGPNDGYTEVATSVARSGLWSVFGQATSLVVALVATPFTIRLLGPARYGLLSLLQSVQTWVGLADFGMGTASTRFAGECHARGDDEGESRATWTSVAITTGVTLVVALALALAAPFVIRSILHIRGGLVDPGEVAVRLIAIVCVTTVLLGTANTPLLVRLRWRELTLIMAISTTGSIALIPVALAAFGGGVITSALVSVVLGVINVVVLLFVALRLQPQLRRPRVSREAAGKLLRYGSALTIAGIANIPLNTADRLMLAHFRGTTTVAYYVVAWRLATLLTVIPIAVCQPIFPGFVRLHGSGQIDALRTLYHQALQGLFLVLTPTMLLLAFIAEPFLKLWAGRTYGVHSTDLFYIMVVGVWFDAAGWLPAYFLSLDHMKQFARLRVAEVIPYVALTAVLTSRYGPTGAAIAWTARLVFDATSLFVMARRLGGVTVSPFSSRRARSALFPVVLGLILLLLALVTTSLAERAGCAIGIVVIYGLTVWRLALTQRERDGLRVLAPTGRFRSVQT